MKDSNEPVLANNPSRRKRNKKDKEVKTQLAEYTSLQDVPNLMI
jgi:hypothetical protein